MTENLAVFEIKVPVEQIGTVMGKLNTLGCWPDGMDPEDSDGLVTMKIRIPFDQVRFAEIYIESVPRAQIELVD